MEAAQPHLFELEAASEAVLETATEEPVVEIRVSERRRKTVAAYWEGPRIVVLVPKRLAKRDRQAYADELAAKLIANRNKTRPTDSGLHERAMYLSRTFLGGEAVPTAVQWSTRQMHRWGSCTATDGTIRVSARLQGAPQFVIDAVLVHELAHLLHSDHSPAFYELANKFPRQGDAELFLKGMTFAAKS
ncbi:MAG: M48 family metallopeptidase [Acidimicrobiales bacterium]|nr:M48 family metallopeptidase [Acidimicrobiales bacterium]